MGDYYCKGRLLREKLPHDSSGTIAAVLIAVGTITAGMIGAGTFYAGKFR